MEQITSEDLKRLTDSLARIAVRVNTLEEDVSRLKESMKKAEPAIRQAFHLVRF